jgi:hypothetical protein
MKEIISTNGFKIIVDDEDYNRLMKYSWAVYKSPTSTMYYASTQSLKKKIGYAISMHRMVLGLEEQKNMNIVDHINRNSLDNRKSNLRIVNKKENEMNSGVRKNNTSGYKGVNHRKDTKKYRAYIFINGKQKNVGNYKTAKEAAIAYNKEIVKFFPEYAYINLIGEE